MKVNIIEIKTTEVDLPDELFINDDMPTITTWSTKNIKDENAALYIKKRYPDIATIKEIDTGRIIAEW